MDELKPCPFCGGKAYLYQTYFFIPKFNDYWISCSECHAGMSTFSSKEEAVKAWNSRNENSEIQDIKNDLEKIIEKLA